MKTRVERGVVECSGKLYTISTAIKLNHVQKLWREKDAIESGNVYQSGKR